MAPRATRGSGHDVEDGGAPHARDPARPDLTAAAVVLRCSPRCWPRGRREAAGHHRPQHRAAHRGRRRARLGRPDPDRHHRVLAGHRRARRPRCSSATVSAAASCRCGPRAQDCARRGYVVMTWSARGFGASGGAIALDQPDYEVADARALVDWLPRGPR
ncbi:alpha/beta hydrolase family protein [Yinghuangia aomiensis]